MATVSKKNVLLCVVPFLILAISSMTAAQGMIGQNFQIKPKPGMEMQWEAAYKEHLKWHEERNDSWNWVTYQIMSGPDAGQYIVRTGGHEWKDWDELGGMGMEDQANFLETAGKYSESYTSSWDRVHPNLSRIPEGDGYKIFQLTNVRVKNGMLGDFIAVVGKYHAAFEKTNSPDLYATVTTETGGRAGDATFVGFYKDYASLDQDPMAMMKMMEEVYGRQESASILEDFNACVEEMHTSLIFLREDLTYRAPTTTSDE